jgi:hypothetical protein
MSNLYIEIYQTNETAKFRIDNPKFEETKYSNKGALYRALEKEYGRCTSKILVETSGKPQQVGWSFEKREYYSDVGIGKPIKYLNKKERDSLTFMCGTYVSVHTALPEVTTKHYFAKF